MSPAGSCQIPAATYWITRRLAQEDCDIAKALPRRQSEAEERYL